MRLKRFLILGLAIISVANVVACADMDRVMGALKDTNNSMNSRYGNSKYYQGSTVQKTVSTTDKMADLYFNIADFQRDFSTTMQTSYGREVFVKNILIDSLLDMVYDSLNEENYSFKIKIKNDYSHYLVRRLNYYVNNTPLKKEVDDISADVSEILEDIKRDM